VFDESFDDAVWSLDCLGVPLLLPSPAVHPNGWQVRSATVREAIVFGADVRLPASLDVRLLLDPQGRLWMSTLPQELSMMHAAAQRAVGRVLVGGLGLAVYPQYAQSLGAVEEIVVVERSPAVVALVEPTLRRAARVPIRVVLADVVDYLEHDVGATYDTIYLDTWDTVNPTHLPHVNRLRALAERRLAPGGRAYAWGYQWMLRLFDDAARALIAVEPSRRWSWLGRQSLSARRLLGPLLIELDEAPDENDEAALSRCRAYAQRVRQPAPQRTLVATP
jgi:spermidine synthase